MRIFIAAIGLMLSITVSANNFSSQYGAMVIMGDGSLPYRMDRLALLEGSMNHGLNVGCNGVTLTTGFDQAIDGLSAYMEALTNNAGGLIYNYLIFTQPTFYALMENMNKHIEKALYANMADCNSIRQMARRHMEISEAKDQCIAEGNSPYICNDGDELDKRAEFLKTELKKEWGSLSCQVTGNSCEPINSPSVFAAKVGGLTEEDEDELGPLISGVDDDGNSVPRKETVRMKYSEYHSKYVESLKSSINALVDGSSTPTRESNKESSDPYIVAMPARMYGDLIALRETSPAEYDTALNSIASARAISKITSKVNLLINAQASGLSLASNEISEDQKFVINSDIAHLRNELNEMVDIVKAKDYQRTVMESVRGYAAASSLNQMDPSDRRGFE